MTNILISVSIIFIMVVNGVSGSILITPVYAKYLNNVKILSYSKPNEQATWYEGTTILAVNGSLLTSQLNDGKTNISIDKEFNLILIKITDDNNGFLNFTCQTTLGIVHKYSVTIEVDVKPKYQYVTNDTTSLEVTLEINPTHLIYRVDEISSWFIPKGKQCDNDRDPYKFNFVHRTLGNCKRAQCLVQFPFNASERVDAQRCVQISFKNINQKDEFFVLPQNLTAPPLPLKPTKAGSMSSTSVRGQNNGRGSEITPTSTSPGEKNVISTEGTPTVPTDRTSHSGASNVKGMFTLGLYVLSLFFQYCRLV